MKKLLAAAAMMVAMMITGCPNDSVPYVAPPQLGVVDSSARDWRFQWSYNMPVHPEPMPGGLLQFVMPGPTSNVHYLNAPFTAGAVTPTQISVTFKVVSDHPVYNGLIDPTCANPATFHVWIERRGDDGTQDFYRWWALHGGYVFGSADNQVHTITVPLKYDQWTSVHGHQDAMQFDETLHDLMAVGLTFGGTGGCLGHGMDLLSGSARFELLNYSVQ